MSKILFDDKIKEKLEQHRPSYQEAAWDRLKPGLPIPWYLSILPRNLAYYISGLSVIALISTIFYYQNQKNKLSEEIATLKNNVQVKTDTLFIKNQHIDTVYIEKYSIRYVPVEKEKIVYIEYSEKAPNSQITHLESEHKINEENKNSPQIKNSQKKELASSSEEDSEIEEENAREQDKNLALNTPETPESKKSPNKSNFKWPNTKLGIMAGFYGFKQLAMGPTVEMKLANNFSINLGLVFSGQYSQELGKPEEYNRKTGRDFHERYKKFLDKGAPPKEGEIKEISITSSFIKMPIYFNYELKTYSPFSFLISTGTNLNLKNYQIVNYESNVQNQEKYNSFDSVVKPKVFNGMFYGMGLQYKYKKFNAQLLPYFDFEFRKQEFENAPKRFGVFSTIKFEL